MRMWSDITSWLQASGQSYHLTTFWFLRLLGFTYTFAYLSLFRQVIPLLGSNGLTPAERVLNGSAVAGFFDRPSLFWFVHSDTVLWLMALLGLLLSIAILIGYANAPMMVVNWFVYLSFVNIGQVWYGYGWEMQLVETGFLAIFMVPLWDPRPFRIQPSKLFVWLLRWLTMRVNLGSGLIKLRGSSCWTEFTCLNRFFQTQPIPNPLSPLMQHLPGFVKKLGVGFTHFVQLIPPFGAFFENKWRGIRVWSGVLLVSLQFMLILVGNLSFLNWVTLAATVSFFDDKALRRVTPSFILSRLDSTDTVKRSTWRLATEVAVVALVMILSIPVVVNLISPGQAMNASYNDWHIVNTYGAFGSVREQRTELIVQGTVSESVKNASWETYDFRAKPDRVDESLPVVAPYQPRLAWQFWFASMSRPRAEPWLMHLTYDLLTGDDETRSLLASDPFNGEEPEYIRILSYEYELQPPGGTATWNRSLRGVWLPPVSKENKELRLYLERLELT